MKPLIITLTFIIGLAFNADAQESIIKDTSKISEVFTEEIMPEFPGGVDSLLKFINLNMQYANRRDKHRNVGIVKVTFVVEKDGSINDTIKVIQPLSEYYDNEAIRIVKAMPKWKPGTLNGNPVRVEFTLPVKF